MSLLASVLDNHRILLLATQYLSTQRNCKLSISPQEKEDNKIHRLREVGERGAEDAYLQLRELQAIEEHINPMKQHCARSPEIMMQNMHCHIRALWNLSQEAAAQALQKNIRHSEFVRIKLLLEDTEPRRQGHIFCLRKSQPTKCH